MTTPDMRFTDLHGERIAYRDVGTGDTLLLVHGMAGSSATWDAVLGPLSERFRVIAPDLPGTARRRSPGATTPSARSRRSSATCSTTSTSRG